MGEIMAEKKATKQPDKTRLNKKVEENEKKSNAKKTNTKKSTPKTSKAESKKTLKADSSKEDVSVELKDVTRSPRPKTKIAKKRSVKGKVDRVAIVAGLRTPFARQLSYFSRLNAIELGKMVVSEMLTRSEIDLSLIERVVFGQVLIQPEAPNIAREIVLGTAMQVNTDAYSVSRACATSFQSTVCIAESIMAGSISVGIAGGADSSSVVPIGVTKKLSALLLRFSKAKSFKLQFFDF